MTVKLNEDQIERLAIMTCRLHYDQTSKVFEELSYLFLENLEDSPSESSKRISFECLSNRVLASSYLICAKAKIDDAWKNCVDHMNSCETKHYRSLKGYNSMEEIAFVAYYNSAQSIRTFISASSNELKKQSERDKELNHPKLSSCLHQATMYLDETIKALSQNY